MTEIATFNPTVPAVPDRRGLTDDEVVEILEGYRQEAENARKTGPSSRDKKWNEHNDLYWNRHDFSQKASWQAKETMPEVPTFVDRFAGSLKEALTATPKGFYTVEDDTDEGGDLVGAVKRMVDVWLQRIGTNQVGQPMAFPGIFEEQMKMGAMMACSALVNWKDDVKGGRVAMETVDPRSVWLDHTGRGLYRVRRLELDKHDLMKMATMRDGRGRPVYNLEAMEALVASISEDARQERERLSGTGQEITSNRAPIELHEYRASLLNPDGTLASDSGLSVVANRKFLIRGPERNPFWHGQDWLLFAPLVTVPLAPYGRSYMEDIGPISHAYTELTNLILDAVTMSSMKAFLLNPTALLEPSQAKTGIQPNKVFLVEDGVDLERGVIREINLGSLDPSAMSVVQLLTNKLSEAGGQNEVGLGQFAPNSRTSATEIVESQQGKGALVLSVASNVEMRFLNPALDMIWKTGLQHASANDPALSRAVGRELWASLHRHRKELIQRPVTFSARGISTLIHKSRRLRALMSALQILGANEILMREFLQRTDPGRLSELILDLLDVDVSKLQASEREQMIRGLTEQVGARREQAQAGTRGQAPGGAANIAQGAAQALGVQ